MPDNLPHGSAMHCPNMSVSVKGIYLYVVVRYVLTTFFLMDNAVMPWYDDVMAWEISHLQALEAESIHIFREVASEFQRPVMLYSIGKDSSVMLRLAQKAFHPGPSRFPCCTSTPAISSRK